MQANEFKSDKLIQNIVKINNIINELENFKKFKITNKNRCVQKTFSNALSEAINHIVDCGSILEQVLSFNCQSNLKKEKTVSGFIRESIREVRGEMMNIKAIQISMYQIMDVGKQSMSEFLQATSLGDVCLIRLCAQPILEFRCTFLGSQQDENNETLYKFHVYYSFNEINKKMRKHGNVQRYYLNEIADVKMIK